MSVVEDAKMSAQMMLGYAVILAILIVMDILMNSSLKHVLYWPKRSLDRIVSEENGLVVLH